jgi:mono/diheme cytochrome c family protein
VRRKLVYAAGILGALFLLAQAVPYGRGHTNPSVRAEPSWNAPVTRELARRACFDCHSNLTRWPWYSNVAPVSWLVYNDVRGGREELNFSRWDVAQEPSAAEVAEIVRSGEMPPFQYVLMHRRAKLSKTERSALAAALQATLSADPAGR